MVSICEFCANCCCVISAIGIIFYLVLIGFVFNDNFYLYAALDKGSTAMHLAIAMAVNYFTKFDLFDFFIL
jgi:hypothetical protein